MNLASARRASVLTVAVVVASWAALAQTAVPAPAVLSPEAAAILQQVLAGEPLQELELRHRSFFFPTLTGSTLSVVAFRVGREGLLLGARDELGVDVEGMPLEAAMLELFGSVLVEGVEQQRFASRFLLPRSAFADGISAPYSFAESLTPGRYELVWGLRDQVSGRATARRDVLEVPEFGGTLQLSSVVVATGFRAAVGGSRSGDVSAGVRVFTATFDDDLERSFDRQAAPEISLTFIVTGAVADPATRDFDLEIGYRVLDEQGTSVLRLPPQVSTRNTISQPVPIAQAESLEPGREYRFEITVRDRRGEAEAVALVPFRLHR